MMAQVGQTASTKPAPFEEDAHRVISSVRNAFAAILDSLPGHVARGHEVSKALGIHRKLGWQIANIVYEPDPFAAAQHIPGQTSVRSFLDAATERHVNRELIASAEDAMAEFERLIQVHAGDRESLDMMLTVCSDESNQAARIELRKMGFRCNSSIWGVQAKTQLAAHFLYPGSREGWFDLAVVRGLVELRRIRSNVPWLVTRTRMDHDDGPRQQPMREPLDAAGDEGGDTSGVPLLREFCSQPLPQFQRTITPRGFIQDELVGGPAGKTAAVDCFTGEVLRNLHSRYRDEHNWAWRIRVRMRTPCRFLVFDQLIHEDLFGPIEPEFRVFSELSEDAEELRTDELERVRIPIPGSVRYLGKGISRIRTPEVPRYADIVRHVLDRLGWDSERFDVYRIRMEYPPIPTGIAMQNGLLGSPSQSRDA